MVQHDRIHKLVRFQVLTAASIKVTVFWVVAPCSLVEVNRRFRGTCCLHHQDPDDGGPSETSVNFHQTTRYSNPEDSHLRIHI
jgi:hypothetical protein